MFNCIFTLLNIRQFFTTLAVRKLEMNVIASKIKSKTMSLSLFETKSNFNNNS